MLSIGITGQNGFIGGHLWKSISLHRDSYELVEFQKSFFDHEEKLDAFVLQCDVIVHLAAMNRHSNEQIIYNTNIQLVKSLVASLHRTESRAHVIMSSSLQEEKHNLYGKSKKEGRKLFLEWENDSDGKFLGLIIPNVFGPFGKPNYNSVVATFCHQVSISEKPEILEDQTVSLIYVGELVDKILNCIEERCSNEKLKIEATSHIKVSGILALLKTFKRKYQDNGEIPLLKSTFELNLFNTYRSYIDIKSYFPVKFIEYKDPRGSFVEIIRLGIGGQVSFSTTVTGITRGNHFHTRKIERFSVIKGKALIKLRKVGTEEVLDFYLDGDEPGYIDMPIWYTHNITNIGEDVLYTIFWINESYNPEDADTYFLKV